MKKSSLIFKTYVLLFACFSLASATVGAQAGARIILKDGDSLGGGTVLSLSRPFIDGDGKVGFTGNIEIGGVPHDFTYYDNGLLFLDTDALPDDLNTFEAFMGVGDQAEFIISSRFNGEDAVYTHKGLLAVENVQAPGLPAGINSTFHSRPRMVPNGTAFWIAGLNNGSGGTNSVGRIFYTVNSAGAISPLLITGATEIAGRVITANSSALDFDYGVSDNGNNYLNLLSLDAPGGGNTRALVRNGNTILAEVGQSAGRSEKWESIDLMDVNNNGDEVFTGDTDGDIETDEFIAFNGTIVLREGATVGGVTLTSGATVRGVDLNNNGQLLHIWKIEDAEYLFVGQADDLAATSVLMVSQSDQLDTDGDGSADFSIVDIYTFASSAALTDDHRIFVELGLVATSGNTTEMEAIAEILDFALPVTYRSFTADLQDDRSTLLRWQTTAEEDNRGFGVERSTPSAPEVWDNLGFVTGRGDAQGQTGYSFIDKTPLSGENLYRLRQLNYDGEVDVSGIVSVNLTGSQTGYTVFPTLVAGRRLTLRWNGRVAPAAPTVNLSIPARR